VWVVRRLALLAAIAFCTFAGQNPDRWTVAQNSYFEVYSESGDEAARNTLFSFEQLRVFFEQNEFLGFAFRASRGHKVRVVVFRSTKEYEDYRLRTIADAYYVSDASGDSIIMAASSARAFGVAVHEYTHYVLHATGLKVPAWLNEGLAEYFSTMRFDENAYQLGGDLPARTKALRGGSWLPLAVLFESANESSIPDARKMADIFYAESWALADMLAASPQYAGHFRELVSEFAAGTNAAQAFRKVYGKSLDEVATELKKRIGKSRPSRFSLNEPTGFEAKQGYQLSSFEERSLLAQISLVSGHVEQARIRYQELSGERPNDPDVLTALGTIAGRQGNREENLKRWQEAIRYGSTDADLCYRYALLAEEAGRDAQDVKVALERALVLVPDFDDARYKLALIESQVGEYKSAVEQLRAMRTPVGTRRFAYCVAMASALTELDERGEAQKAAQEAEKAAETEAERLQAKQMAYMAATDLKVQFVTDSEGHAQIMTTRVEHGTTDWNPFIEPADHIERARGVLSEVFCRAGKLSGFLVRTVDGPVTVDVPDPLHVLVRNGPGEFYCGPVEGKEVGAEYAVVKNEGKTTNVLRGLTFQ
jgi:hypothetical protein